MYLLKSCSSNGGKLKAFLITFNFINGSKKPSEKIIVPPFFVTRIHSKIPFICSSQVGRLIRTLVVYTMSK